jgi:hypothetical protein
MRGRRFVPYGTGLLYGSKSVSASLRFEIHASLERVRAGSLMGIGDELSLRQTFELTLDRCFWRSGPGVCRRGVCRRGVCRRGVCRRGVCRGFGLPN